MTLLCPHFRKNNDFFSYMVLQASMGEISFCGASFGRPVAGVEDGRVI